MASIFKQKYTVAGNNGKRIRKQSACWYIDYKTAEGTRKRVKAFKDKQATAQLAAKLEKESELAMAGIVDRFKEHRKTPLAEHLSDFKASLIAKGNTKEYVQQTTNRVKAVFDGCKFVFWNDISANVIQKHLASLRDMESGISTKTSNYYLQDVKHFCRFMIQDQRASESPVEHLSKVAVKSNGEIRRSLEADEVRLLLEVTEQEPNRFNATGHQRVMLYRIAAESGLRANELRSLTASSFDLKKCTVTTKAEDSKNGKESILPLRKETAATMQSFLAGKMPHTKAFAMPSKYRMADMLRADCKAAGIEYEDKGQGKLDFHALRHTFSSMLAASGVHPKTAQELMRHSDINLTMSLYSHTLRGQTAKAVESLPDFTLPSSRSQIAIATGTDDTPVENACKPAYKKLAKNPYFDGQRLFAIGSDAVQEQCNISQNRGEANPMQSAELGTKKEPMSSTDTGSKTTTPGRTRTCGLRIRNPLTKNSNDSKSKDLEHTETSAYKPAYKENPKTGQNEPAPLPSDLAEIVSIWPELPEHIKAAIKALIQTGGK